MGPGGFILGLVIVITGALALLFVIRKAAPRADRLPVTADWIEQLSLDRYCPMLRLLEPEDLRLMRSQRGCTSAMVAEFRRQRYRIFRGYLRCLRDDFARVSLALKLLMAQASQDRPDLAAMLMRSQWQFGFGMALVELRLALYRLGIGTVDARSVLRVFDGLRLELRALVPSSGALGA